MADKKTSTSSTAEPQPAVPDSALRSAVGQLTLIEHCLCPLDARKSLTENFVHETSYSFSKDGKRKQASVRVSCPSGLTAEDEFYLWGLLSLTLSQPKPAPNLVVTRHYRASPAD